ncbi:hypothetical protein DF182_16650 [Chitinophaga flava]|uniref:Uncharacterized protein n=1 Tax=Chitinophaga flava TaxID=2259036 RepID=A0A365XQ25_9BACT|nr:hypothetical protein DF182_16650 [Chitinophaga flava]
MICTERLPCGRSFIILPGSGAVLLLLLLLLLLSLLMLPLPLSLLPLVCGSTTVFPILPSLPTTLKRRPFSVMIS